MQDPHDPFSEDVNRPPTAPGVRVQHAPPQDHGHDAEEPDLDNIGGLNPLLAAAHPLLTTIGQLRSGRLRPSRDALRTGLVAAFQDFESRAHRAGISERNVITARYVLGTAIDEAAAVVVQEGPVAWYQKSLLSELNLDAQGGEKIFRIAGTLAKNPEGERELLQFIWVVLSQGFQGVFASMDDGASKLVALRERLYQLLQKGEPSPLPELSPALDEKPFKRQAMLGWLPMWVTAAVAGGVLLLIYSGFLIALNKSSGPVETAIETLRQQAPVIQRKADSPRLEKLLLAQMQTGQIKIVDGANRSTITLQGDTFFAPGSDTIAPDATSLLREVASALVSIPGTIIVSGHTDDRPVQGGRFRNNFELSKARAEAVVALLTEKLGRERLQAVGEDQNKPLVPNTTDANRAVNRRVEITLHHEGGATAK